MDISTEIRKLPPSSVRELVQILEFNDLWKKLMDSIPKVLEKDKYECKITRANPHKYRSEHFKLIENASKATGRACTEILFDEWGTSGRIRPCLGHLLHLLTINELFRAADYVAVQLLQIKPPARPMEGPAAPVPTNISDIVDPELENVERILNEINYPSSIISTLMNNSYDVNVNKSNSNNTQVIPKIVISELGTNNDVPMVVDNKICHVIRNNKVVRSNREEQTNTISDMMKFSHTDISTSTTSVNDQGIMPNISDLMNLSNFNSNTGTIQNTSNVTFNETDSDIPALSALNIKLITENESQQNVPILSDLLHNTSESIISDKDNLPKLDSLYQDEYVPNLSVFNIEPRSELLPQMSALITNKDQDENQLPQINVIQTESSSSIPPFDVLLSDKQGSSKHFLPILDQFDAQSETSSFASSKNSNASSETSQKTNNSQRSDLSRSSRNNCVSPLPNLSLNTLLPQFTYQEIEVATNNFDETPHKNCRQIESSEPERNGRFLGSGAFGSVYLALNFCDKPVAVKKLFLNNVDVVNVDDTVTKQFRNEVEVLSKYKHENLLSLIGYSCDGPTYCLLYEFIPGGALKDRLQNTEDKLIWTDRLYIALGTARAVSHLHTAYSTPLIHRDIKTANILLDSTNKPKLCDFGLIKLISNQNTNTNTTAFGTSAYMAREAFRGDVSVKLDTYSFGVVLLELITGLPPLDENREGLDIVTHVEEICEDCDGIASLIDTNAGTWIANDTNFAEELYNISSKCLLENKKKRPTMVEVTENLAELLKKSV